VPNTNDTTLPPAKPSFDRIAYVASQRDDITPFLSEMCMTQSFDDFLTRKMYSPGEPDLIFFDQSIDAKNNRSNLKLRKVETPFLHSAKAHKVLTKLSAVEPNQRGLAGGYDFERKQKPYMYKVWPETFDERLFCEPRSIPKMIAAEFDRQAILVSRLRANIVEDDEEDMLEFYGGDYDPSPEVASFTVFFFAYSALVGLEWQEYRKKHREHNVLGESPSGYDFEKRESEDAKVGRNECIPDCSTCPDTAGYMSFKTAMQYVGVGAEEAYKSVFPGQKDPLFEFRNQFDANRDVAQNMSFPEADDALAEYEEAREVAGAQLDLAFETLSTVSLRGLSADSDAYHSLMEACGRCGDTQRAIKLMELMKKDGFVADSEVLSCFVATFAHNDVGGFDMGASKTGGDAYSSYLQKRLDAVQGSEAPCRLWADSDLPFTEDDALSSGSGTSGDESEVAAAVDSKNGALLDWFSSHPQRKKKKKGRKRRVRKGAVPLEGMPLTDMLSRQLSLGESLLDFLYPELAIDTKSDSCPQCSYVLSESNIVEGWLPCAFQDYTTSCPECQHRFVPRFVVTCASPTFEGSQGSQTPLYCEFLSPWVLRKELQKVIKGETGIEGMLRPEWRSGNDIRATLYWNLIVLCRRYKLPFSFLMQGNFQSRLVLPRAPDKI
jgi:pentatricopeptide repeat protein